MYLPRDVFERLTPEQRRVFLDHRNRQRNDGQQSIPTTSTTPSRNVSAVDQQSLSGTTIDTSQQSNPTSNNASQQFGQRTNNRSINNGNNNNNRSLAALQTGTRYIGKVLQVDDPTDFSGRYRAEIDTRADTICAGPAYSPLWSYCGCHWIPC